MAFGGADHAPGAVKDKNAERVGGFQLCKGATDELHETILNIQSALRQE
jgi:hypothetical protein